MDWPGESGVKAPFSSQEQLLRINLKRFRGGHVFVYHSTLGWRVIKKKKEKREHLKIFQALLPESQGRNLALTVLIVPNSFGSG